MRFVQSSSSSTLCTNPTYQTVTGLSLYHTIPTLTTPNKKPFENIVGKGENAGNQHILLFPHNVFYPSQKNFQFLSHIYCYLQILSIWTCLKFCHLV